jgi:putative DNA primase/helicase
MSTKLIKYITKIINSVEKSDEGAKLPIPAILQAIRTYFPHITVISGSLYFWYRNHYVKLDDTNQEKAFFLKNLLLKLLGKDFISRNFIENIYYELMNDYHISRQLKGCYCVINLKNGMLAIRENEEDLHEHDHSYGHRYVLPYSYDPKAKAPRFEAFLAETIGDENSIKVVYEYMGYILLGNYLSLESALILLGEGRNGKSVLIKTLTKFVGEDNTSYVELQDLGNSNRVVMVDGKLLNVGSDSSDKNFDPSQFKRAISGEPILGRKLYKDSYIIKDIPKFVFAMNNLPFSQGDTSFGLLRRMKIIQYDKIIAENKIDRDLDKKLEAELPGILNLAIEGARRLIKQNGFTSSKAISKAVKSYEDDINMVKRFIGDLSMTHHASTRTSNQQLYAIFSEWCKEEGIKVPSKRYLIAKLKSSGFEPYKNDMTRGFKVSISRSVVMDDSSTDQKHTSRKPLPRSTASELLKNDEDDN